MGIGDHGRKMKTSKGMGRNYTDSLSLSLTAKSCLILATPRTVARQAPLSIARQAPLSMGFSRQEYRSGLPFPFPRDCPNRGIEPGSPALQADSLPTELYRGTTY